MNQCRFCSCEVESDRKPIAVGSWLDAEKIYLCNAHTKLVSDESEIELVEDYYLKDQSWEGALLPLRSIKVTKMALMTLYIELCKWTLMNPPYPRKSPIINLMIILERKLPNNQLSPIHQALLFIHWITIEQGRNIDYIEFDFFNPCDSSLFDTLSMHDYRDKISHYIHNLLKRDNHG